MKNKKTCFCGKECRRGVICDECKLLLRAKKSKSISVIEKFRNDYNKNHGTYISYGKFVVLIDNTARRKRNFDNRRKEENLKTLR